MELWSESLYNSLLVFALLNILDIITTYNAINKQLLGLGKRG